MQGGSFMLHQIRHMVGAAAAVARGSLPLELLEASLATPARVNLPLAPPSTLMLTGAQFRRGARTPTRRLAPSRVRTALGSTAAAAMRVVCGLQCLPRCRCLAPRCAPLAGSAASLSLPPTPCLLLPTPSLQSCSPFKRSWSGAAAAAARWTGDTLELRERGAAAQQQFLSDVMLPALDGLLAGEEWAQWQRDLDALWYDEHELQQLLGTFASWREERRAARVAAALEEAAAREVRGDE